MKHLFLSFIIISNCILFTTMLTAQTIDSTVQKTTTVDKKAIFSEGNFNEYVSKNLVFKKGVVKEDQECVVQFFIDKEGNVTNVRLMKFKDIEVAKRVKEFFQNLPKWIPAEKDGVPVESKYIQVVKIYAR